jgi:hypothetical protein
MRNGSAAVLALAAASCGLTEMAGAPEPAPGQAGCAYLDAPKEAVEYDLARRDPEFERTVAELLAFFGLSDASIRLLPATANYRGVAEARIWINEQGAPAKALIYNPDAVALRGQMANTLWPSHAIAAHELGHLINDHAIVAGTTHEERKNWELVADRFSGLALRFEGAPLRDALDTMGKEGPQSLLYPSWQDRLAKIREGWTVADERLKNSAPRPGERFTCTQLLFSMAVLLPGSDAIPEGLPARVTLALRGEDGQRLDGGFDEPTPVKWTRLSYPGFQVQIKKVPPNPRLHFDASDLRALRSIDLEITAPDSGWPDEVANRTIDSSNLRGFLKMEGLDASGNRIPLVETGHGSVSWQWLRRATPSAPRQIGQDLQVTYRNLRWHETFLKAAGLLE